MTNEIRKALAQRLLEAREKATQGQWHAVDSGREEQAYDPNHPAYSDDSDNMNPTENAYTVSTHENKEGWTTDCGHWGYCISKDNADFIALAANELTNYITAAEAEIEKLSSELQSTYENKNGWQDKATKYWQLSESLQSRITEQERRIAELETQLAEPTAERVSNVDISIAIKYIDDAFIFMGNRFPCEPIPEVVRTMTWLKNLALQSVTKTCSESPSKDSSSLEGFHDAVKDDWDSLPKSSENTDFGYYKVGYFDGAKWRASKIPESPSRSTDDTITNRMGNKESSTVEQWIRLRKMKAELMYPTPGPVENNAHMHSAKAVCRRERAAFREGWDAATVAAGLHLTTESPSCELRPPNSSSKEGNKG